MHEPNAVIVADHGSHLEITINRPEKRNAMNQAVVDALEAAWLRFEEGPWAVAVITGAGDKAFSAGADLTSPPTDDNPAYPNFGTPLTKPVIAAVEGYAVGAGFVLSQSADITVAGEGAQFGYPEARIGATGGGATFITSRVPTKVVTDMLLTSRFWPAERALNAALVSEVTPAGQALAKARELAGLIAANDRASVLALKALIDADTRRTTVEGANLTARLTKFTRDPSRLAAALPGRG